MERDAHYLTVGVFVIAMLVAGFLFAGLFAQPVRKETAQYALHFSTPIENLNRASDVRYLGLKVGEVADIRVLPLSAAGAGLEVRIELDASTPVDGATVAILRQQGVTGVSFIDLAREAGGLPPAEGLQKTAEGLPLIPVHLSELDTMLTRLPALEEKLTQVLSATEAVFTPDNRENMSQLLLNLRNASEPLPGLFTRLDDVGEQLSAVLVAAGQVLGEGNRQHLSSLLVNLDEASAAAPDLVQRLAALEKRLGKLADAANDALSPGNRQHLSSLLQNLDEASTQAPALIGNLRTTTDQLGQTTRQVGQVVGKVGSSLERSLQNTDQTLGTIRAASYRIDKLATDVDRLVVSNEKQLNQLVGQGGEQFKQLLAESRRAAQALRELSEGLQQDPSRILYQPVPQGVELPP